VLQCATVRSGALANLAPRPTRAPVSTATVTARGRVRYHDERIDEAVDAVASAPALISVGAGVDPAHYGELAPLIEVLHGELIATRKVTDKGWLPRTRQVGLTGLHVSPPLCIALGTSGRNNHMVGLRAAGTVVGINTNPDAELFEVCDYGIVGDWREVVPALVGHLATSLAT